MPNDGQARSDAPEDGEQLEEGGQGGEDEGDLNHQGLLLLAEATGVGNEDGGGDDAHHGSHHVLESQGNELSCGGDTLPLEYRVGFGLFHLLLSFSFSLCVVHT